MHKSLQTAAREALGFIRGLHGVQMLGNTPDHHAANLAGALEGVPAFDSVSPMQHAALVEAYAKHSGMLVSEALAIFSSATIGYVPSFCSDGPGYAGPVWVVLFSGGPECVMVFRASRSGEIVVQEISQ